MIELMPNWSLIGVHNLTPQSFNSDDMSNYNAITLWKLTEDNTYHEITPPQEGPSTALEPGKGYWIEISDNF